MKTKVFFLLLIGMAVLVAAEDVRPLRYSSSLGFNLGPELKWTRLQGQDVMMLGFSGGFIVNRSISLGIAVYGVIDPLDLHMQSELPRSPGSNLEMAYGGFKTDFIVFSQRFFQFSAGVLLGAGAVAPGNRFSHHEWEIEAEEADWFFVFEPECRLSWNVSPLLRVGAGASYRRISSLRSEWTDSSRLKGISGSLSLQFGWHGR